MLPEWTRRRDPELSRQLTDYLFSETPIAHD